MKVTVSITIDPIVLEEFSHRYPRKRSKMIEDYMKSVLNIDTNNHVDVSHELELASQQRAKYDEQVKRLKILQEKQERLKLLEEEEKNAIQTKKNDYIQEKIKSIKQNGGFMSDYQYEAEKKGFYSVEDMFGADFDASIEVNRDGR